MLLKNLFLCCLLIPLPCNSFPNIECRTAYGCINSSLVLNTSGEEIHCYASGACANSILINNIGYISDDRETNCYGKRACQNTKLLLGSVEKSMIFSGFLSNSFSDTILSQSRWLSAHSEACLINTNNITVGDGRCDGLRSCININYLSVSNRFIASGMYSLVNSNVYLEYINGTENIYGSSIDDTLVVYFFGYYSGYNTTITCASGTNCYIYCQIDGCINIKLLCNATVSLCRIYRASSSEYFLLKTITTVTEPLETSFTLTSTNTSRYYDQLNNLNVIPHLNEFIIKNNENGNGNGNASEYEYYSQNMYDHSDIDGDCIDYDKNISYIFDDYDATDANRYLDLSDSNASVCCDSANGCSSSVITGLNNVTNNVYCDGKYGCRYSNISSGDGDLSRIYNVHCRGEESCEDARISNFNKVYGTARRGVYNSIVTNGSYLGCFGYKTCENIVISNVGTIVASGDQSLLNGMINSSSSISKASEEIMYVYLIGYRCGELLTINCNENDICVIVCLMEGCESLNITSNVICNSCNFTQVVYLDQNDTIPQFYAPAETS